MIKVQTAVYQLYEDKYKAGFQIVAGQSKNQKIFVNFKTVQGAIQWRNWNWHRWKLGRACYLVKR